jgi:colicin import membrane protein
MIARESFLHGMRSLGLALSIHVLMALLMVLGTMSWKPFRQPTPVGLTIEAVIVDTSEIRDRREEAQQALADAERKKQAEDRRANELEQQREREKDQEVQRQKNIEEKRKKDAQDRLAALRLERERKLKDERQKQERELEQIRKQAADAEKQRKLEAERLKQIESRKEDQAAEQRRKLEAAEQQRQVDAEARAFQAGRQAELADDYEAAIRSQVTQNWLRPPTAQPGLECTLRIVQIPGGEVISAAISGLCNGDEATRRSIIAAVERTGTLPYRGFEDAFQRAIEFKFIYDGDR